MVSRCSCIGLKHWDGTSTCWAGNRSTLPLPASVLNKENVSNKIQNTEKLKPRSLVSPVNNLFIQLVQALLIL